METRANAITTRLEREIAGFVNDSEIYKRIKEEEHEQSIEIINRAD